jgi:hypothetical protein
MTRPIASLPYAAETIVGACRRASPSLGLEARRWTVMQEGGRASLRRGGGGQRSNTVLTPPPPASHTSEAKAMPAWLPPERAQAQMTRPITGARHPCRRCGTGVFEHRRRRAPVTAQIRAPAGHHNQDTDWMGAVGALGAQVAWSRRHPELTKVVVLSNIRPENRLGRADTPATGRCMDDRTSCNKLRNYDGRIQHHS